MVATNRYVYIREKYYILYKKISERVILFKNLSKLVRNKRDISQLRTTTKNYYSKLLSIIVSFQSLLKSIKSVTSRSSIILSIMYIYIYF